MQPLTDNLRKAAILIDSIDRATAKTIVARLDAQQRVQLIAQLESLDEVLPSERQAVLDEFMQIGPLATPEETGGVEIDARLAAKLQQDASQASAYPQQSAGRDTIGEQRLFEFLKQADSAALASLLSEEHPQMIAAVLSHLDHNLAAQVMLALPPSLQSEVMRRLTNLSEMDSVSLHEIESHLRQWVAQQAQDRQHHQVGIEAARGIVAAVGETGRQALMSNLRRHDHQLADHLSTEEPTANALQALSFDELLELDDAQWRALLRRAELEVVVLALAIAPPGTVERFAELLPAHDESALRMRLLRLGPARLSDVEAAQRQLAQLAFELEQRGELAVPRHLSMAA